MASIRRSPWVSGEAEAAIFARHATETAGARIRSFQTFVRGEAEVAHEALPTHPHVSVEKCGWIARHGRTKLDTFESALREARFYTPTSSR